MSTISQNHLEDQKLYAGELYIALGPDVAYPCTMQKKKKS